MKLVLSKVWILYFYRFCNHFHSRILLEFQNNCVSLKMLESLFLSILSKIIARDWRFSPLMQLIFPFLSSNKARPLKQWNLFCNFFSFVYKFSKSTIGQFNNQFTLLDIDSTQWYIIWLKCWLIPIRIDSHNLKPPPLFFEWLWTRWKLFLPFPTQKFSWGFAISMKLF